MFDQSTLPYRMLDQMRAGFLLSAYVYGGGRFHEVSYHGREQVELVKWRAKSMIGGLDENGQVWQPPPGYASGHAHKDAAPILAKDQSQQKLTARVGCFTALRPAWPPRPAYTTSPRPPL